MPWIKRNLYFVITVVVGLGVTGFCAYLLLSALDQNKAASEKYSQDKNNLETLEKKVPYPDRENIDAAQKDAVRVQTFLSEFAKPFAGFPPPPTLNDQQFKDYLLKCIQQFGADATNAGVGLPPPNPNPYAFSFSQQVSVFNYPGEAITPWLQELTEIRAILRILYDAKINYLQTIHRPPAPGEEAASDDYMQVGTVTNTAGTVVTTPYMINFRGFSAEIANVLAGIAASSNCLIVRAIHVQPSRDPLPQLSELLAPAPPEQPRQFFQPQPQPMPMPDNPFMQQNGNPRSGPRRPFMQPQFQPQPVNQPPPGPTGPVAVLSETPLFVTIYIDVVKLKALEAQPPPSAEGTPAGPRRRGPR
jgi:hypothetical protein